MLAEANIIHPARILITGQAGSGKTYLAVDLILRILSLCIDRLIVICPTWSSQDVFRELDGMVKFERDVFEEIEEDTIDKIYHQVLSQVKFCKKNGKPLIRTCLFIDDCGSNKHIHGGRISNFGKIAIQLRHLNMSSIVIVQNPKLVSPNYRENINHCIFFPCHRMDDMVWIYNEFNSQLCSKKSFIKMLKRAWNGGNDDDSDDAVHFLYVFCPPRSKMRFYIDFATELTIRRKPLVNYESIMNRS